MSSDPAYPDTPFSFQQATAGGVRRHTLRAGVRRREVVRLSRGVYAVPDPFDAAQERWEVTLADHIRRLRHALLRFPTAVASHSSAALLHGLELMTVPEAPVELTVVEAVPRSRRVDGVVLHHADSTETEWVDVGGLRATPLPRTVADVLRTRRPPHAVAMADRALSSQALALHTVARELDKQRRWRGRPRALRSLQLVDPARESWLESYSFVTLHELGMQLPLPQVEVLDEGLNFVGRVDGLLPGGVFVEVDGEGKYFLDADPDRALSDVVLQRLGAERVRHDRLEGLGLVGVRWTARQIMQDPSEVRRRINVALRNAQRTEFRGWLRIDGRVGRLGDFEGCWGEEPLDRF